MGSIGNVLRRGAAGLAVAAAALLHGSPVSAQTLDFGACVRIEDVLARLSCYDRAAGRTGPSQAPAPAAPATAPAPAPARAPAPAPMPAPAAPPAPAAAPAAESDPVARFGAESRPAAQQRKEAAQEPSEISARVTAVRKRPTGEHVLTLDNGQVWQQTETRREPQFEVGDVVVIRKGMLGSYLLTLQGGSASSRVRRIS